MPLALIERQVGEACGSECCRDCGRQRIHIGNGLDSGMEVADRSRNQVCHRAEAHARGLQYVDRGFEHSSCVCGTPGATGPPLGGESKPDVGTACLGLDEVPRLKRPVNFTEGFDVRKLIRDAHAEVVGLARCPTRVQFSQIPPAVGWSNSSKETGNFHRPREKLLSPSSLHLLGTITQNVAQLIRVARLFRFRAERFRAGARAGPYFLRKKRARS